MIEHVHHPPGTEIESIGGHYTIIEEGRMNHRGRTLLYWIGIAVVGSSCCGTGGCRFIHIPGYVTAWHNKISTEGLPVSTVDPVIDKTDQMTIKEMLDQQFPHSQISFREA